jgi:UDP-glucose 4-epimerase/UDP-glucuronate decarboxylase
MTHTAKRVLITGGAGFIGHHLALRLVEAGANVTLVDNLRRGEADADLQALLARPGVTLVQADLSDAGAYRALGQGYDEVYHLAAVVGVGNVLSQPWETLRINSLATTFLLDWFLAGGGGKLFFASTSEVYAWTRLFLPIAVPTPEDVPLGLVELSNPRVTYACTKIFGEVAVTHACRQAGLPSVIVRFHNVYGPRMGFSHVIPQIYERALKASGPLTVYNVQHRRAFCHVSDAVSAMLHLMGLEDAPQGAVNIGNDHEEYAIGDLARELLRVAGLDREIVGAADAADPIDRRCPDIGKLRALGFAPRVGLAAGLADTLAWYRRRFESDGRA